MADTDGMSRTSKKSNSHQPSHFFAKISPFPDVDDEHTTKMTTTTIGDRKTASSSQPSSKRVMTPIRLPRQRRRRCLVWHRRDLRLEDNALYSFDNHQSNNNKLNNDDNDDVQEVRSLYVLDPQEFIPRRTAFDHSLWSVTRGPHASRLLLEALTNLRQQLRLQSVGSCDLLIRRGDPTHIVPALCAELQVDEVRWSHEPGTYEQNISDAVQFKLRSTLSPPPRVVGSP